MKPGHDIENDVEGYRCAGCRGWFPSLHWFQRDTASGAARCLDCARGLASGSLVPVLPVAAAGELPPAGC